MFSRREKNRYRLVLSASVGFFLFLLWILYTADIGKDSIFFIPAKMLPCGDKIGHCFLFGLLTLGANAAFKFRRIHRYNIYLGTLSVTCFVMAEEISQYFITGRTLDILDLLADGAGIWIFTRISSKADQEV